ncbi:hypothetical protein B0H34DRAFT_676379 [Crassisporium funariophilum]|nr:hypothetical protein B0H34DRAFT_676379 [Crassisporium funariophilum]
MPSCFSFSRNIQEIFVVYPGKIHSCADGWILPQVIAFIGTTAHWIINGRMTSIILDFTKVTQAHSGKYLAAQIAESLCEIWHTRDNALNNNTLVTELGDLLPTFKGVEVEFDALLTSSTLLSNCKTQRGSVHVADQLDLGEYNDLPELDVDAQFAALEDVDGERLVGNKDPKLDNKEDGIVPDVGSSNQDMVDDILPEVKLVGRLGLLSSRDSTVGCIAIAKLRALANKIVNSPTLKADLLTKCLCAGVKDKLMIWDVQTTISLLQSPMASKIDHALGKGKRVGKPSMHLATADNAAKPKATLRGARADNNGLPGPIPVKTHTHDKG